MTASITKPTKSVEDICQLIEKYQLMSSKDYATMRGRWFRPNRKEVADPEQFRKWLVLNRYLTDFVAKVLSGRKPDQLVLNQYRLQDQLISGLMAGACLAIDSLDRPVAIEVLSSHSAEDKSILMGFQQAALKVMKVQHPNVGRTVDIGEAHGLHYLVKEYYEGETLEDMLARKGKLPYLKVTRLMALALAGVEALHAEGIPAGDCALVRQSVRARGRLCCCEPSCTTAEQGADQPCHFENIHVSRCNKGASIGETMLVMLRL